MASNKQENASEVKKESRDDIAQNTRKPAKSGKKPTKSAAPPEDSVRCQVTQFTLGAVAALLLLILLLTDLKAGRAGSATGLVGYYICLGLYGLFGWGVWVVPAALIYLTIFWRRAIRTRTAIAKCVAASLVVLIASALSFQSVTLSKVADLPAFYHIGKMWKLALPEGGVIVNVGGIFGALFGGLLNLLFKKMTWLIALLILAVAILILAEVTPQRALRAIVGAFRRLFAFLRDRARRRAERKEEADKPGEEEGTPRRPRLFPEEGPAKTRPEKPGKKSGSSRKDVGITPISYVDVQTGEVISDLPITDTLPPVLSGDAPAKKPAPAPKQEPYTNPYAEPDKKEKETADPDLFGMLFPDGVSDAPPAGGDVNVMPRRPGAVDMPDPIPVYDHKSAPERAEPANPPAETKKKESAGSFEKTTEQRFAEIADLQEPDENEHALTDPDLADPDEIQSKPEYKYPPITLLKKDTGGMNADHSAELQSNGVKLVSVLESFRVKAKITSISRGPTITRYELLPDQGVRVRAIANLVDDIALNLATSGVRIEAPIPGKPAVGIEVPNAERETVYLGDLLEHPKFVQAESKVTAALGMDVAGEPIFVDIAKMPHLLISGTTGSGKSICIHSLLVSLLFHAAPDEVKLIIIDPKKVDFGVYDRLPHLLVPVVTQPKKAAGALSWAVSEMERRYEVIEQAGVRNNKAYNKLIEEGELEGEKMPSIVIAIDELADLMMTARDTVEESICRLAQKARAAGMHLIVGTQRPSVDVITGLIKANIPSRIALMLKTIADSRTILDIGGAEKLIGNGDMLYAPVGAMKPIRVQGAFVSDREVEAICDYIRKEAGEPVYDQKTIDEIREHEAECEEVGKKASFGAMDGGDDEEEDPKFVESVRLAVESGKISTSLLQRRLQLGYGRAAKIIDRMEQMGIVSAPDGQKPRNVLMNMQEFQEMIMHTTE